MLPRTPGITTGTTGRSPAWADITTTTDSTAQRVVLMNEEVAPDAPACNKTAECPSAPGAPLILLAMPVLPAETWETTMNPKPISIQLYTLRDEASRDFPGVLRRVAQIGYKGVEPAGFHGFSPREFRRFVEDLGMVVSSTHSPWAGPDNLAEVIDACGEMGITLTAGGYGPGDFATLDAIRKTAETTARMQETLAAAGLTLVIHNHAWEFEKIDGRLKYDIFAELCPAVQFELDTYWAANFGANNAPEMVRRFSKRSPLLHIKDGPMVPPDSVYNAATDQLEVVPGANSALLPVGSGNNDIKGIVAAMDPSVTQWLVVEQDTSDTDMFECVAESYSYLVGNGLAAGNK